MRTAEPAEPGKFYFALPRVLQLIRGRSVIRAESNWIEAYFPGVAIYLLSYLLLAEVAAPRLSSASILWLLLLALGAWVLWLFVLYVNSVVIRALRRIGLFTTRSNSRAQNIIIGTETTIFAFVLANSATWLRVLGWIWLAIVALNLTAAVVLAVLRPRLEVQ
jgi:hypothetical protein